MLNVTGNDYRQAYKMGYPVCDEQKMGFVIVRTVVHACRLGAKRFYACGFKRINFSALKMSERRH